MAVHCSVPVAYPAAEGRLTHAERLEAVGKLAGGNHRSAGNCRRAAGAGATILIAEDDDGTRTVVARMLERIGHTVLLAPDGQQALRLAEQHAGSVDLLLTDVMMPGMSGIQLRQRRLTVPVLYMSGYPEGAQEEAAGFRLETDFIAKPFSSTVLGRKIAEKLGRTPA